MPDANVLVVEDDDTIRRLLVDYLKEHAHVTVESARDGVEALHLIQTRPYGVVLLDVMMPKMSGVDLLNSLQALRRDPSLRKARATDWPPVVVITATSDAVLPNDVFDQRFPDLVRGVFRKPLDVEQLRVTVADCLKLPRSRD